MAIFCYKQLTTSTHELKELFKKQREEKGLTLLQAQKITLIPFKYLQALEQGNFSELPKARAHRIAYVRDYAKNLGLNPSMCVSQFIHEQGLINTLSNTPHKKRFSFLHLPSVSIILRNVLIGGFISLFVGYLAWQVNGILKPPQLTIFNPTDGSISEQTRIALQGSTEPESKLTINGENAEVNNKGIFDIPIELTPGLNTLTISATKKHGKTTTKIVNIIVKQETFTSRINTGG
jgi:cytoskeletal protein RodZ